MIHSMTRPLGVTAAILTLVGGAVPAAAQSTSQPPATISSKPLPDPMTLNKLVWKTMIAVDNANDSGNYSVLRDLASPSFQKMNNAANLGQTFASLRQQHLDLANTLLLAPTYTQSLSYVREDMVRAQGYFGLRPMAVTFDLYFQWIEDDWTLNGIAIGSTELSAVQPE